MNIKSSKIKLFSTQQQQHLLVWYYTICMQTLLMQMPSYKHSHECALHKQNRKSLFCFSQEITIPVKYIDSSFIALLLHLETNKRSRVFLFKLIFVLYNSNIVRWVENSYWCYGLPYNQKKFRAEQYNRQLQIIY